MEEVAQGRFLGHSVGRGFLYEYRCPYGKRFLETAPELNAPALCHTCYTGDAGGRIKELRRRQLRKSLKED